MPVGSVRGLFIWIERLVICCQRECFGFRKRVRFRKRECFGFRKRVRFRKRECIVRCQRRQGRGRQGGCPHRRDLRPGAHRHDRR